MKYLLGNGRPSQQEEGNKLEKENKEPGLPPRTWGSLRSNDVPVHSGESRPVGDGTEVCRRDHNRRSLPIHEAGYREFRIAEIRSGELIELVSGSAVD